MCLPLYGTEVILLSHTHKHTPSPSVNETFMILHTREDPHLFLLPFVFFYWLLKNALFVQKMMTDLKVKKEKINTVETKQTISLSKF